MIKKIVEENKIPDISRDIQGLLNQIEWIEKGMKKELYSGNKEELITNYQKLLKELDFVKKPFILYQEDFDKSQNSKLLKIIEKDFEKLVFNYVFSGKAGCGKTFISRAIFNTIRRITDTGSTWENVRFMSIKEEYTNYLVSMKNDKADFYIPKVNQPFLVIDDIGIEKPATESAHQFVANIIEMRYEFWNRNKTSSTIITTNLGSKEIVDFYGDRVLDRLFDMTTIFTFKNESYRKNNKKIIEL